MKRFQKTAGPVHGFQWENISFITCRAKKRKRNSTAYEGKFLQDLDIETAAKEQKEKKIGAAVVQVSKPV